MPYPIEWQQPISVTVGGHLAEIPADNWPENAPGIYFFARHYGEACHPFYVGKSTNINNRLANYLLHNNGAQMRAILTNENNAAADLGILQGPRFFYYGYWVGVQGVPPRVGISRAERALIRHYVDEGYVLINTHYNRIDYYEIEMVGHQCCALPPMVYLPT